MRTGFLNTYGSPDCAQELRKTYSIDVELKRLNIDIVALQETRTEDEGSLRGANYTFYWKGKSSSETREHGVGFAVRNQLINAIETPVGVSERIMFLRLNTKSGFVTLISAYAPTLNSKPETKDQFYDQLEETVRRVNPTDRLHILGDFNARVGQDTWPECLGAHGIGKLNDNGQRLLEFCSKHQLCVTNTFFKGKMMRKVSWMHPRSKHWHQLDLALSRRRDLRETLHTRAFHSADCDTDHSLVATKVRLVPRRVHSSKPLGRKKINLFKTRDMEVVESFGRLVREEVATWDSTASAQVEWEKLKSLLTDTAGKVFGYQKIKPYDWFLENEEHLVPLIDSKRQAALNFRLNPCDATREDLTKAKAALQRSTRFFANAYWTELCQSIQACASAGDTGGVYAGIKRALGPTPKKTAPLKEIDGSVITDSTRQMASWVEHYKVLYSCPVDIKPDAVELVPKLATWHELDAAPTVEELYLAVKQLKCGKSPGKDDVVTEVVKLECLLPILHNHLAKCWEENYVPQDMRDANIVTLYKGKGDRGDCNCYRGISLLSIVGKAFARAILGKLQRLADRVYPEAQCGFRYQRSTVDMIFSLRQLQEKCREQHTPLVVAFVDLNKAFDSVSREGLYSVLVRIGCPPKLLRIVQSFHEGMEVTVLHNGNISTPFDVHCGVRQGCVLAPTLFGIFFSVLLKVAFGDEQQGVHLHTRTDGKLYNISMLKSKRYREDLFVDSLLFADDAAFVAHDQAQLQNLIDKFARACHLFSMSINCKKTVILAQGCLEQPVILLNGEPLQVVNKFCYLGSQLSSNLSLDAEIDSRIGKAASTFGRLRSRAWDNRHLTVKTKMLVYQSCVLSTLLYGAETWTTYAKQERRLNTFHLRCLRNILGITWKDRVTNESVLGEAQLPSITAILKKKRLRWLGHVHRMEHIRLPRQILLGQVADAKRSVGRPMLRYKDCAKRDMVAFNIPSSRWEELAEDRAKWRRLIHAGQSKHDDAWFKVLKEKRVRRHERASNPRPPGGAYTCRECGRRILSRIGLFSHERKCCLNHLS
ncbi:uncharacterized protein LOC124531734 [Vanessa cardui]|uniref:uncharacterized protein LOC124531734 n=1 Tax=Vanessa cardui TaxID=171605 RepID=UPI001F12D779|nr:uncharacterized protein LOC124531734 [Vanessa cardui]